MNMDEQQTKYLSALHRLPGIGEGRMRMVVEYFGTPEEAWKAPEQAWKASGIGAKAATLACQHRSTLDPNNIWEEMLRADIRPIIESDPAYPKLLRSIDNAPFLMYVRGTLPHPDKPLIGIVGTRRPTAYGRQVTERLASELVSAGFGIVSGLAFGIDSLAHRATLEADGYTAAVLGNGLDDTCIAPRTHLPLAHSLLAKGGALISEYAPGVQATVGTFPARNRIIAGLTLGTLVVEAAERSGSLITAHWALELGREVFAVPGSINSRLSDGPNSLIRSGAKLVSGVGHILEELRPLLSTPVGTTSEHPLSNAPAGLSEHEAHIFRFLESEPRHIDSLAKLTTLETTHLSAALTLLEIKGLAKNVGSMHYIRVS